MARREPIRIKKSRRGTFKAAAKRRGMSMSRLASAVKRNPKKYSKSLRRKAGFYNGIVRKRKK